MESVSEFYIEGVYWSLRVRVLWPYRPHRCESNWPTCLLLVASFHSPANPGMRKEISDDVTP